MSTLETYLGKPAKRSRATPKKTFDTTRLSDFLTTLDVGVQPSIHINGPGFATALVSVDFGSPLVQARLSNEETVELHSHLRDLAKEMLPGRENAIRINHDGPNGMYWASIG